MRKKVFGRKLSRERDTRRALFRSLIRAFALNGKISTTKAKAKSIQPDIEKLVKLSKSKDINNLRQIHAFLGNDTETAKVFEKIGKLFDSKKSGFTRLINLPRRTGDFAQMVRLEWSEKVVTNEEDKQILASKVRKNDKSKKAKSKKAEIVEADVVNEKPAKKKTLKERLTGLGKKK